jgi:hypothetical protein
VGDNKQNHTPTLEELEALPEEQRRDVLLEVLKNRVRELVRTAALRPHTTRQFLPEDLIPPFAEFARTAFEVEYNLDYVDDFRRRRAAARAKTWMIPWRRFRVKALWKEYLPDLCAEIGAADGLWRQVLEEIFSEIGFPKINGQAATIEEFLEFDCSQEIIQGLDPLAFHYFTEAVEGDFEYLLSNLSVVREHTDEIMSELRASVAAGRAPAIEPATAQAPATTTAAVIASEPEQVEWSQETAHKIASLVVQLRERFRGMGRMHERVCRELDAQNLPRPPSCDWHKLRYVEALKDPQYRSTVSKWISTREARE